MRVELLPSSLPPSDQQFLVTYLINDQVAIDAGSVGLLADLKRQEQIKHVFVTHQHIDHIATLPILLENVYEPGPRSIEVLSAKDVLHLLQKDLFNGRIWPDFFALSTPDDPFLITTSLEAGKPALGSRLQGPLRTGVLCFDILQISSRSSGHFAYLHFHPKMR